MAELKPDTTPGQFFSEILPAFAAERKGELTEEQLAVEHSIAVELEGEGGGSWTVSFSKGDVVVNSGISADANPVVHSDVKHWYEALSGKHAIPGLEAEDLLKFDPSLFKPAMLTQLAMIRGTLRVLVIDDEIEDASVTIKFGENPPNEPQTTIQTDLSLLNDMNSGTFNPQMALMSSGVKVLGDMGLALQVAALAMVR